MRELKGVFLTLLSTGCLGSELPTAQREGVGDNAAVPVVRFRPDSLPFAAYSGLAEPERRIITDAAEMEAVWSRIHAGMMSVPPVPSVDFAEEMVLMAALGGKPSSGYAIRIDSVAAHGAGLEVFVRQIAPASDCVVLAVITAPVDLVRVARLGTRVAYRDAVEVHECS